MYFVLQGIKVIFLGKINNYLKFDSWHLYHAMYLLCFKNRVVRILMWIVFRFQVRRKATISGTCRLQTIWNWKGCQRKIKENLQQMKTMAFTNQISKIVQCLKSNHFFQNFWLHLTHCTSLRKQRHTMWVVFYWSFLRIYTLEYNIETMPKIQ